LNRFIVLIDSLLLAAFVNPAIYTFPLFPLLLFLFPSPLYRLTVLNMCGVNKCGKILKKINKQRRKEISISFHFSFLSEKKIINKVPAIASINISFPTFLSTTHSDIVNQIPSSISNVIP
jgi:hypothetical protein